MTAQQNNQRVANLNEFVIYFVALDLKKESITSLITVYFLPIVNFIFYRIIFHSKIYYTTVLTSDMRYLYYVLAFKRISSIVRKQFIERWLADNFTFALAQLVAYSPGSSWLIEIGLTK